MSRIASPARTATGGAAGLQELPAIDPARDRTRLVHVAAGAVFASCVAFAATRLATELDTGLLTPWWVNAGGAAIIALLWSWFRLATAARATRALHITAAVATAALLVPIAYGMGSTVWWLALVAFSAALMGSRREATVWAVVITVAVSVAVILEPHIQVPGAAGEGPLEIGMAKVAFAIVVVGIAVGVRRVIERQTIALGLSRAEAERSNRAKTQILAHMSHEVRSPLNTIIAMTDLSLRDAPTLALAHQLRTAHNSARLLLRLIQDVLDASRLDVDDGLAVRHEPFRLHHALTEVLEPLRRQIEEAGLEYTAAAAPGMAERRLGDGDRVCQIALNLVSNALKFTERGAISVRLTEGPGDPDLVCLSVRDTGRGIPSAHLERIFQPYVQVGSTVGRREAGAGLGLTICRLLAERMGGRVEVDSTPNLGTELRVWMRLPVERLDDERPGPVDLLAVGIASASPAPADVVEDTLTVLVVDDDPVNRLVLQKLLSTIGHLATQKDSGPGALAAIEREDFDLILTDLDMPGLDGIELARRIRALERRDRRPPPPIIAVTGHASPEWRTRAFEAGMSGFLTKPFTVAELSNEIERVIALVPWGDGSRRHPVHSITTRSRRAELRGE
jgi:signal transduction histidine kinase/FixJ family two-component response regulator